MEKIRNQREKIGGLRLEYESATDQKKLNILAEIRDEESKLKEMLTPKTHNL